MITGTYYLTQYGVEADEIRSLILRRRLQVLVHSCIYYRLNSSIISDHQWQQWANELVELQAKYPKICERVDYHKDFIDFDGSTGYDLPYTNSEIMNRAQQLLKWEGNNDTIRNRRINERIRINFSKPSVSHLIRINP